ncbi:SPFH domain-containing protein [Streptomyces sp. NPDC000851]
MDTGLIGIIIGAAVLLMLLMASVKIVPKYERGVIFRLGRIIGAKGPGLFFIIPVVDRMVRVSLRTMRSTSRRRTSSPRTPPRRRFPDRGTGLLPTDGISRGYPCAHVIPQTHTFQSPRTPMRSRPYA